MNEPAAVTKTRELRGNEGFSIFPRAASSWCVLDMFGWIRGFVSVPISVAYVRRWCARMVCGNIIHSFAVGVPFNDSNNWVGACNRWASDFGFKISSLLRERIKWGYVTGSKAHTQQLRQPHPLMNRKISIKHKEKWKAEKREKKETHAEAGNINIWSKINRAFFTFTQFMCFPYVST